MAAAVAFGGNKICRCCLRSCENPFNIFDLKKNINTIALTQCIFEICDVQVSPDDNLPESICIPCYDYLKNGYTFRLQVQKNNSFLISILKEDLIEELPQSDDNENIEFTETKDSIEIKYPVEEYQTSDIKRISDNEVILINNEKSTNIIDSNSIENPVENVDENNYINEFVNYIDDLNQDKNDIKKFECKLCDKKFKYLRNLHYHEKQQHLHEGYKHCQYCSEKFYKNYDLRRHIQMEHIKIKEYTCTICQMKFYTKSELNRHIKFHSNIKDFQCLQCEQKFYDKATLDGHIRIVHLKERNYSCELCNKKFSTNSKVRRHQNTQICIANSTKVISTINVGQHLVILDYDPNSNIEIEEINESELSPHENVITENNITSNLTATEPIINYNTISDPIQHITDPVQKFLN